MRTRTTRVSQLLRCLTGDVGRGVGELGSRAGRSGVEPEVKQRHRARLRCRDRQRHDPGDVPVKRGRLKPKAAGLASADDPGDRGQDGCSVAADGLPDRRSVNGRRR
jgi:hypothetical protein